MKYKTPLLYGYVRFSMPYKRLQGLKSLSDLNNVCEWQITSNYFSQVVYYQQSSVDHYQVLYVVNYFDYK